MVAMTAVHFSFKSPCLKCLSRTLKRKPSVEVSRPRSSNETGKCLTKSGSACSPLMYLKLQLLENYKHTNYQIVVNKFKFETYYHCKTFAVFLHICMKRKLIVSHKGINKDIRAL